MLHICIVSIFELPVKVLTKKSNEKNKTKKIRKREMISFNKLNRGSSFSSLPLLLL